MNEIKIERKKAKNRNRDDQNKSTKTTLVRVVVVRVNVPATVRRGGLPLSTMVFDVPGSTSCATASPFADTSYRNNEPPESRTVLEKIKN